MGYRKRVVAFVWMRGGDGSWTNSRKQKEEYYVVLSRGRRERGEEGYIILTHGKVKQSFNYLLEQESSICLILASIAAACIETGTKRSGI